MCDFSIGVKKYVNGSYRGKDPIGSLMHDFSCKRADDMKNAVLSDKVQLLVIVKKADTHKIAVRLQAKRKSYRI